MYSLHPLKNKMTELQSKTNTGFSRDCLESIVCPSFLPKPRKSSRYSRLHSAGNQKLQKRKKHKWQNRQQQDYVLIGKTICQNNTQVDGKMNSAKIGPILP